MKNRNKTTDSIEDVASSATDQARDAFVTVNNTIIKALEQNRLMTQNLMKAMQEESLRFMNMRLEHTSRAFERSRECQGISAILTLQHDWLMDIARDYAELNKRFTEMLHDAAEQATEQQSEVVQDTGRIAKPEAAGERVAAE